MIKIGSYALLASITLISFCPILMAVAENINCHENMTIESEVEEKEITQCDHIDFFKNTSPQNFLEIQLDNIAFFYASKFITKAIRYNIENKIIPQLSPIPPPSEWGKQKETIIIRV